MGGWQGTREGSQVLHAENGFAWKVGRIIHSFIFARNCILVCL